jgi:serine protease Do
MTSAFAVFCRAAPAGLAVLVLLAGAPDASARTPTESFADLVELLTPAVVNISTTQQAPANPHGEDADEFFDYFGLPNPHDEGAPNGQPVTSLGSGFIVDASGLVVTNNHVIEGASAITVILDDETQLVAEILGRDARTDLALLKIDAVGPLPFVEFGDSDAARVGDWVIAIGNPFGLGNTVTAGIVSARGRDINAGPYDDFIQTDAPINRGNSGGPMFNMEGKVIGINTLIFSPSGGSVGIGFATPASLASPIIEQLASHGHARRGWLGVRIQTVSAEIAENLGLAEAAGALVASVTEGGPAETAEILPGDVILTFDGIEVPTRRDLPRIVADTPVGKEVDVEVWRERERVTIAVTIGELAEKPEALAAIEPPPESTDGTAAETPGQVAVAGLVVAALTPELRTRFGLAEDAAGLIVLEVDEGAAHSGFEVGDLIVAVGSREVDDPEALAQAVETLRESGADAAFLLRDRAGSRRFVPLEFGTG